MKFLAAFFLCALSVIEVIAQPANTWIHFDQPYAKIQVGADAIYRITPELLQTSGFPATGINIENIQLFHRGNEQSIIVQDDGDGIFNNTDYVEFYGRKNDGTLDQQLYKSPDLQQHNYYNLYSDTTAYFLTIGNTNGKRIQFYSDNSTSLTPETFHLENKLTLYTEQYSSGKDYGEIQLTVFDAAEGWMSSQILYSEAPRVFEITGISHQLTSQSQPNIEMVLTGRGPKDNPVSIFVGSRLVSEVTLSGYEWKKISFPVEWTEIDAQGKLTMSVKVSGEATRASVNYIKLIYAQEIDMDNRESFNINLLSNNVGKSLVQIKNPHPGTRVFDITSAENPVEIGATANTTLDLIVRNTSTEKTLFATSAFLVPDIKKISFRQIDPNDHNYVIISHRSLRKPSGNYSDPVKAYADYRASETGGNFDTLVVTIDQLYDQFSYGEQTPLAVFNFMRFLADTHAPQYLFIIGKGLDVYYHYYRTPGSYSYHDLVPTAGYPASDIAFTAGLNGSTFGPGVSTGRITASNPAEVAAYLNKVKETETRPFDDLRRKHVLHLSGGINSGEPQAFRQYLEELRPLAEGFHLGGHVSAVAKQSTDLKLINIADEVNQGIDLVTFFGHSSPGTLDFDVGFVTNPVLGYHNKGKYPVLLMNGCDAGAFFLNTNLFGENWINTADKGAIGFIAHSSFGFVNQLRRYTEKFYQVGFEDSVFISKGVGDVQRESVRRYLAAFGSGPIDITHVQNMVLLGDPAVPLFGAQYPDYAIEDESLTIAPFGDDRITTAADSFAINFIVRNYGQARNKPMRVEITRNQHGLPPVTYDSIFAPVLYSDTLTFIIRGANIDYAGDNTFAVKIDADNGVQELREDNNIAYIDYFIPSNSTQNLYPGKFSIINKRDISFSFQHTNLLSGEREFLLEVDTTKSFDSPYKKSFSIIATVLALQQVTLLENDSVVYFWRTKIANPADNESLEWVASSFTYIYNGPKGWAQSSFAQFPENVYTGIERNETSRRIFFKETSTLVDIKTFGVDAGKPADSMSVKIGNAEYNLNTQGWGCRTNALNIIAFDKSSATPYLALPFQWYNVANRACGREPWVINNYVSSEMVTGNGDDLIKLIDNIKPGDSVILFTMGNAAYSLWPDQAKTKLSELGIDAGQLGALVDGEPVIIFGRKSSTAGTSRFVRPGANPQSSTLATSQTITGRFTSGKIKSTVIGPSKTWMDLILKIKEKEPSDQVYVDIYGIDEEGQETLIIDSIASSTDISSIDANLYPFIRLVYSNIDELNLTAVQLNKWFVIFDPLPEGLLFYNDSRDPVNVQAGQPWTGSYRFINVSDQEFDSALSVSVKVFNHPSHGSINNFITIDAPPPGDTTTFNVIINTSGLGGKNDIDVFANPRTQREQSYGNNDIILPNHLTVTDEYINPVLDVTIDGRYIHDEEFVSATPTILALLWDENHFLKITDTTHVEIFLSDPCIDGQCDFRRMNFSQPNVAWQPATDTSFFTVNFQPSTLQDGYYRLKILATDNTGNASGREPYEISFYVKSENSITILDPYPNPTTGDIHFDCTVTGTDPVMLNMEIYTTEGLWVRSVTENDFNTLHVGDNVLHWTPATVDGQSLPVGIYIYRMRVGRLGDVLLKHGKIVIGK